MKTTIIAVIALVLAIIAFIGMAALVVQMDDIQGRMVSESDMQIGEISANVLNEILTEEQREAGLMLSKGSDGRVALVQSYAIMPDGQLGVVRLWFSADTSITEVRYAADLEFLGYLKAGGTHWPGPRMTEPEN